MKTLQHLLERNLVWAEVISEKESHFFSQLAKQQTPDYLWIGCSDSRVPASQIVDQPPGELFVHRNIANIVTQTDINALSAIQYAVEVLKVKHIIICGHYSCGGVEAVIKNDAHGQIGQWLMPIKEVFQADKNCFNGLGHDEQLDLLCELNVKAQVKSVCNTAIVQNAWGKGHDLSVHGWIYNLESGILQDLEVDVTSRDVD
ncbi:MAG: carbonic anhydrase [Chloroflexi bacterium]|nr:carbonic anhydrase [Chloroflexota bacterium]